MTEHEFTQRVKRRLREAKINKGLFITQIYKSTDLSYPTVSRSFTRGDKTNISLLTLKELCDAMSVSLSSLLDSPDIDEKLELKNVRTER